jgi:primase-polymerase (primpol)-like protein
MRSCLHCHSQIPESARITMLYCGTRCRVAACRARKRGGLPPALLERDRWVRYSPAKVPLQTNGRPASSTDPGTWTTHERAAASTVGAGLGFVLNGDGVVCLDLDHCIDHGGELAPWARSILDLAPATYVEVSPSGHGLHIWGTGDFAAGRVFEYQDGKIEAYATGRYLTVTGHAYKSAPLALAPLDGMLATLGV